MSARRGQVPDPSVTEARIGEPAHLGLGIRRRRRIGRTTVLDGRRRSVSVAAAVRKHGPAPLLDDVFVEPQDRRAAHEPRADRGGEGQAKVPTFRRKGAPSDHRRRSLSGIGPPLVEMSAAVDSGAVHALRLASHDTLYYDVEYNGEASRCHIEGQPLGRQR